MIILISAKQGAGKSTLANNIVKNFSLYSKFSFAEPLYRVHHAMWDILEGEYGIPREKKSSDFLQYLGTEFGRKRDPDMWVNCARNKIEKNGLKYLVNDDCRFVNEYDAFPDALKIRLECDRYIRKLRADSWRENENHASETGLDAYARSGKFHLYLDSGKRSENEIFTIVSHLIREQFIPNELMKHGGRMADDYFDLANSVYKTPEV